jgi:hypothetical protein
VQAPRPLSERPLAALLREAANARAGGCVVVRDREGMRHGVWLEDGYVVGAHVAGRFDPLLALLRARGALDERAHRACIEALYAATVRSGVLAMELGGVTPAALRDALCAQLVARLDALLGLAADSGHDAALESGSVPAGELCVRMPVGSLLRRTSAEAAIRAAASSEATTRDAARRRLRETARRLHPDCHGALDPDARQQLADELAQATAAYHGFS